MFDSLRFRCAGGTRFFDESDRGLTFDLLLLFGFNQDFGVQIGGTRNGADRHDLPIGSGSNFLKHE